MRTDHSKSRSGFASISILRLSIIWIVAIGATIIAYKTAQNMLEPLPEQFRSPYMRGVSNEFQSKSHYFISMRRAFLQIALAPLPLLFIFDYAAARQRKKQKNIQAWDKLSGFSFSELGGIYVLAWCAWFMFSHSGVVIRFVQSTWRPNTSVFYTFFALGFILWLAVFLYKVVSLSNEIDRSRNRHALSD